MLVTVVESRLSNTATQATSYGFPPAASAELAVLSGLIIPSSSHGPSAGDAQQAANHDPCGNGEDRAVQPSLLPRMCYRRHPLLRPHAHDGERLPFVCSTRILWQLQRRPAR